MPVGAKRQTAHPTGVPGQRGADGLTGVGVPQPDRIVVAGCQPVPVGAKRHTVACRCARSGAAPIGWPVSAFHNRTVLSQLAEASRCPSGLNATPITLSVCPVSGAPMGWPVSAFHNRTVLSSPAAGQPMAVGAKGHTYSPRRWCPVRGAPIGWPVSAFHNRTVLS